MKKELALCPDNLCTNRRSNRTRPRRRSLSTLLEETTPVVALSRLYSRLMEEPVSPALTLRLLHAQLACTALLGCASGSLLVVLPLLLWAGGALNACRKSIKAAQE